MMKQYVKPQIIEEELEIIDLIAASNFGEEQPGDFVVNLWDE